MRALLVCGLLSMVGAGCGGSDKCASQFSGKWIGTTITDSVELDANCTFSYEGADGCKSTGDYSAPLSSQGSIEVNITASTDGACIPAGMHTCAYSASSTTFTMNCGFGTTSYSR